MAFKSLKIQNFKSIQEAKLDFSKINILIGNNRSGKYSVLQAIGLLKQSEGHLEWNGTCVSLGSFKDAKNVLSKENEIGISISGSTSKLSDVIRSVDITQIEP
jgi:AAA15 family ATPase/GTPase